MEFRDLKRQYEALKEEIDARVSGVITSSHFISGPEVKELEEKLAEYVGVRHCVTCANGTDALTLACMVWQVGPGDAVFVPDFTFFSSGESPASLGAHIVFVDVQRDTFNMDPESLERAVEAVIREGKYRPRVVVAVDLFGQPADYERIRPICDKFGLLLLEDGAQGFGGEVREGDVIRKACSFGDISTTSFFPAKPLGCYGDGGAIFTDNDEWAALLRSYCVHGKSVESKYDNLRLGMNSRLDTLQAAILLPKLAAFDAYEVEAVNRAADWYGEELAGTDLELPIIRAGFTSSWAQYTVKLPKRLERDLVQKALKEAGIPSMVYYMKPMHLQGAFAGTGSENADCPVTEELCRCVLSLPMHPYMKKEEVEFIAKELKSL
ncbi:MAG: DegT/DnrJ/EryC1/StrS family aminotransferase [Eubacterium sp.]|nr:DegT/DnrJ/EryC1/StrS family aminotransferase [Eubacterium sp.]